MKEFKTYSFRNQVIQSALIFLFGAIPVSYMMCPSCFMDFHTGFPIALFSGLMWLFLWKGNEYIYVFIDGFVSWLETPLKRMFIGLGVRIVYSAIIVTALTFIFFILVFKQEMNELFFTELMKTGLISLVICAIISLFFTARGFLLAWRQAAIDAEKLRREHISSQYEALKNQVNPHFLFNSLNALSSLVYDDPKKAIEFINRLSDVYRYVLDSKDKEAISLSEELTFIKSYLFLLQARFENNLTVKIEVDITSGYIPPMALQMLIENAAKHNEISDEHALNIYVYSKEDYIFVVNNLNYKEKKADTTGIGLENIRSRYRVLSDRPVLVESTQDKFSVGLPVLQIV